MKDPAAVRPALAVAGLLAVVLSARTPGADATRLAVAGAGRRADAPDDAGFAAWRGVSSCTSSACHNMDTGRDRTSGDYARGSEYAVWAGLDPHAKAYQVLFDRRSVNIARNLNAFADPENRPPAHKNLLCLRCHVAPEAATAVDAAPVWFGDGVGCESCHGAAGRWLAAHVGSGWGGMSPAEKAKLGFRDAKDLTVRARTCTDCHVGGDRAEVNHDLYAAGHPPLDYEYSSFLDRYRPFQHWSQADDRRRHPAYEADAWAVGQAVTARAALRLLEKRATAAAGQTHARPWPEFAEYDCSSCHHGLEQQRYRTVTPTKTGAPAWTWFTAMTPLFPPGADATRLAEDDVSRLTRLDVLRGEMERPLPDARKVAVEAAALADFYDEWLNRFSGSLRNPARLDSDALRAGLARLTGPKGQGIARGGWEDARQVYYAVAAYDRSLDAAEPDPRTAAAVRGLGDLLRPPADWDTPPAFDAGRVIKALQEIHNRIESRQ